MRSEEIKTKMTNFVFFLGFLREYSEFLQFLNRFLQTLKCATLLLFNRIVKKLVTANDLYHCKLSRVEGVNPRMQSAMFYSENVRKARHASALVCYKLQCSFIIHSYVLTRAVVVWINLSSLATLSCKHVNSHLFFQLIPNKRKEISNDYLLLYSCVFGLAISPLRT